MRAFAEAYEDEQFVQQVVAQLPWGHHVRLLTKVKERAEREWYIRQATHHGWSQNVLVHQIESRLFERQGKALTNFKRTLPAVQSELAQQLLKDPYKVDFLTLGPEILLPLHLRCFVVIELKIGDFQPEFAGKMNFYLAAIDDQLRHPGDNPTIGIILCKGKNEVIVEYALRDSSKPMGVAQYQLTTSLPA